MRLLEKIAQAESATSFDPAATGKAINQMAQQVGVYANRANKAEQDLASAQKALSLSNRDKDYNFSEMNRLRKALGISTAKSNQLGTTLARTQKQLDQKTIGATNAAKKVQSLLQEKARKGLWDNKGVGAGEKGVVDFGKSKLTNQAKAPTDKSTGPSLLSKLDTATRSVGSTIRGLAPVEARAALAPISSSNSDVNDRIIGGAAMALPAAGGAAYGAKKILNARRAAQAAKQVNPTLLRKLMGR